MKAAIIVLASILLIQTVAFAGGGHQHGPNGEHLGGGFAEGNATGPVKLSDQAVENLGIETIKVKRRSSAATRALYGKLVAHPKLISSVGARFSGKIEKLFVMEGDYVAIDEELVKVRPIQVGASPVTLKASVAGYVTNVMVNRGETFQGGEDLVEVTDVSKLLFRGELFDSNLVEKIKTGMPCSVELTALSGREISCKVELIDSVFRGTPPVLYIYSVVPNSDGALKPNMSGKLHIETGKRAKRILVPQDAVLGDFNDRFVFIRSGNTFTRKPVVLGYEQNSEVHIKEGIGVGDKVVVQGQYQLQFAKSGEAVEDSHDHDHDHDHENAKDSKTEHQHDEDSHSHDHEGHKH